MLNSCSPRWRKSELKRGGADWRWSESWGRSSQWWCRAWSPGYKDLAHRWTMQRHLLPSPFQLSLTFPRDLLALPWVCRISSCVSIYIFIILTQFMCFYLQNQSWNASNDLPPDQNSPAAPWQTCPPPTWRWVICSTLVDLWHYLVDIFYVLDSFYVMYCLSDLWAMSSLVLFVSMLFS